ncbi:MAG: M20 family metallo-hydrolase [Bacteroidia bacterium]|nr:M20 family metallo-hydrolase [Bacteroidia bacterium]
MITDELVSESVEILKAIIEIPSLSREENDVADYLEKKFTSWGLHPKRNGNNLWMSNANWSEGKPVILLNSHIDTVRPARGWTYEPFKATVEEERITGLGSNDAGASVVSLLGAFRHYYEAGCLPYNLIFCASAEEEVSGENGVASVLDHLGKIDLAIVGEPTQMQIAIAEKGLVVLDCEAKGRAGHAARNEGENAIYKAIKDIQILEKYRFPLESAVLGPVKITVTQIEAGQQHNVVPDLCHFVVDVRTNEFYSNEEAFRIISGLIQSEVRPRSFRLNSSGISADHPLVLRGIEMGLQIYGSPTTSDQAVIPYPSIKLGPGDSARSHTANEYILISEIKEGIVTYIKLLEGLKF